MKKIINFLSNHIFILYIIVFLIMFYKHTIVTLGQADDVWFLEHAKTMNLMDYTIMRINGWTSRNITEILLLSMLKLNKYVWFIIDSLMFVLIYHSIRKICFIDKSKNNVVLSVILLMIFTVIKFSLFGDAGWYATTINYVWQLGTGLYTLSFIRRIAHGEKISYFRIPLLFISLIIATNQEQMSALIFAFYLLFAIYDFYKNKRLSKIVLAVVLISLSLLIYHMLCPGNAARKIVETAAYYPEFGSFGIVEKALLGIFSTLSIGFTHTHFTLLFFSMFLVFLIYMCFKNKVKILYTISVSAIMLCTVLISFSDCFYNLAFNKILYNIFSVYASQPKTITIDKNVVLMLLYALAVTIIIGIVLFKCFPKEKAIYICLLLAGAFCSRFILGFSASIYVSGIRTFINSFYLIMIAAFTLASNSLPFKKNEDIESLE